MEAKLRYGRDYHIYKDYERLYGNLDILKFVTVKKLVETGEYEEWKDYKEFKEWCDFKEKGDWKNSKNYIEWEISKINS
ncbi:MAG: hypothetical protein QME35_02050 [Thermoanaerobacteraceae bacterium]|jgi:thioredoxin-related protein|nr:hypothetical protein [Thermoanaerobacteraceae bacterium]